MKIKGTTYLLLFAAFLLNYSCVEEVNLSTEVEFESILVVEATITDQLSYQEVRLSRTYQLEEDGPSPEINALVKVVSDTGITYSFQEISEGLYQSNSEFAALENVEYRIEIVTENGRDYASSNVQLTMPSQIDALYVQRDFNENNEEGISVYVDASGPNGSSQFYRYEYEETYKIIAPKYSPLELIIQNDDFPYTIFDIEGLEGNELIEFFVSLQPRTEQKEVCYNTVKSNEIILANASYFNNDAIEKYRVRFLNRDNYIISHRYSILVRQFVQSPDSYAFYDVLNNFSESESLFSQLQPGLISGNISSLSNPSELIVGLFEVASVDEQRLFFDYEDLFPNEDLPPYYIQCDAVFTPNLFQPPIADIYIPYSPMQDRINDGFQYWDLNLNGGFLKPYQLVLPACGDCTVLGETEVPDFWVD